MKKNPISCYYISMKNLKEEMIFTSINLPNWQLARIAAIQKQIKDQNIYSIIEYCVNVYLKSNKIKPEREKAHQYNTSPSKYEKISVYWEIDFYNKLRMKAHHNRMSASLIIHLALLACLLKMLTKTASETKIDFCRYQNIIAKISPFSVSILETMLLFPSPDS